MQYQSTIWNEAVMDLVAGGRREYELGGGSPSGADATEGGEALTHSGSHGALTETVSQIGSNGTLAVRLASQIVDYIRLEGLAAGARLPERRLAEHLRVSRNPVRSALQLLAGHGLVSGEKGGGYVVLEAAHSQDVPRGEEDAAVAEEQAYLAIAEDRLNGKLGDRISENEMQRRYQLSRAQLSRILRRMDGEGWAARLPGHGWEFRPILTSPHSYYESFRFRILVEPAGILEPTFQLNRQALEICRQEQQELAAGKAAHVPPGHLFDANVRLHETIAACSGNTFFLEGLQRINRLRRLVEYRKIVDRSLALERCRQHVTIVDLLLKGDRDSASSYMRFHLGRISDEKAGSDRVTSQED